MSWQKVETKEPLVPGTPYRSVYYWKVPYSVHLASAMINAVRAAAHILALAGIVVDRAEVMNAALTTQTPGSRYQRWKLVVYWKRKG